MTKQWKKLATIGAKAGTDLKESDGTVLADTAVKNASIALGVSGTSLTLTNAGNGVTLAKANVGLSGVHDDANKFEVVADSTEGRASFRTNAGSTVTYDVYSSAARTQVDHLRGGTLPGGSGTLESTSGSQTKATAAETAAKAQESANRVTFPSNSTEGQFSFSIGGGSAVVNDVFSSAERTKLDNLRLGTLPGGSGTIESTSGSQSKVDGRLSSTEKTRLNDGKSPDNNKTFENALITINANGTLSGAGSGTPSLASIAGIVPKAGGGFGESVASKTGAVSFSSGTISYGTLPAGVGGTGLTSTSTLLNANVTTFSVDKGNLIVWSNLNSNLTPSNTDHDWTITWYNGAGTSLGTTVIRANVASSNVALDIMETVSNGASSTINLGGAVTSGNIQTTTVTKNSVVCTLKAQIIDGSGWDFK